MLRESDKVQQVEGEPHRRWFWDDFFDLLVWDEGGRVTGFQLRYPSPVGQRVLTWRQGQRCLHQQIDEGDDDYTQFDMTRLLVRDGVFDHAFVRDEFRRRAAKLDASLTQVILEQMHEFARTQQIKQ